MNFDFDPEPSFSDTTNPFPKDVSEDEANVSGGDLFHVQEPGITDVVIASDVYLSCMNHALSTDKEEVMGLLVGWHDSPSGITYVSKSILLKRLDKRKDRVEISQDQLSLAIDMVAEMEGRRCEANRAETRETALADPDNKGPLAEAARRILEEKVPLTVVGWYHSHPHITVFPSAVDCRTQFQYQRLNPVFIGVIFGVYSYSKDTGAGQLPYISFTSYEAPIEVGRGEYGEEVITGGDLTHRLIPTSIAPAPAHLREDLGWGVAGMERLCILVLEESNDTYKTVTDQTMGVLAKMNNACHHSQSVCNILSRLVQPLSQSLQDHGTR